MRRFTNVLAIGLVGVVLVAPPARGASAGPQAATSAAAKVGDSTLKSQIAVFGANDVVEACRALEDAAADGTATDEQIDDLLRNLDDVARAVRALGEHAVEL